MILGSLTEVMGINEDGVTARRRKAINRARKDPNVNKSKNTFVKVKNKKGRTITIPK